MEAGGNGTSANHLLDQAKQWPNKGSVVGLLGQLPQPVKDAGGRIVARFQKLSSTQKIVGGALLVLGVGYLARGGKGHDRDEQADTLHELLLFVNDRIEGYKLATTESQDAQLRSYYQQLVSQSQQFAHELNDHLRQQNGGRETGTTFKGKLYRQWMDAKAALTGHDEQAILGSNVYGEEWAIKAFKDALAANTLTGSLRQVVERQYAQSRKTYQELKQRQANR